jgi:hypothetical protein
VVWLAILGGANTMKNVSYAMAFILSVQAICSPCTGVNRALSKDDRDRFSAIVSDQLKKKELTSVITEHLQTEPVEVLQSFEYRHSRVLYINTHVTDEVYLFFKSDPASSLYLTSWGGAAASEEGPEIVKWLRREAAGLSPKLMQCFAWHVTQDRDM